MTSIGMGAASTHEFMTHDAGNRSFLTIPGVTFPASGPARDRDSLTLDANAGMTISDNPYLDGSINAEYSRHYEDLGGALTVGFRW